MSSKTKKKLILLVLVVLLIFFWKDNTDSKVSVSYIGFGAQETVGGSLHLLKVGDDHFIIDAGIFYGAEGENSPFPDEIEVDKIKGVFITHAHADHVGRLPLLLEKGYEGPIYMTSVTKDITIVNLLSGIKYADFGEETFHYTKNNTNERKPVYLERFDYGEYEVKEKNRRYIRSKRENLEEKGFYLSSSTVEHLENELLNKLEKQIVALDYNQLVNLHKEVSIEFLYTSHLPGSAMVKFDIADKTVLFSGDIGSDNSPFLHPNIPYDGKLDFLFVEGTYGFEVKEQLSEQQRKEFRQYIGHAISNNERVIIPAFAIDRTQQVLYEIKRAIDEELIPSDIIVRTYSPTAEKITNLYQMYSNNEQEYKMYFSPIMFTDIFNISNLLINPKGLNNMYDLNIEYGEIAIMTSGMISTGFSEEIVKKYIEDESTHFILVSYQDPGEIGGQIKNGHQELYIDGNIYQVKAQTYSSSAFGGHGNIAMIFYVFNSIQPEQIFLVHLNEKDGPNLKKAYEGKYSRTDIIVPQKKEEFILFSY